MQRIYDLVVAEHFKRYRQILFLVGPRQAGKTTVSLHQKESMDTGLSSSLHYFQEITKAPYAFQVGFDGEFVQADCFKKKTPTIVPAQTFLAQLI